MLKPNEQYLKKISNYTKTEAIIILILILIMLMLYTDKNYTFNDIFGSSLLVFVLILNHIIIIKNKIELWKDIKKIRYYSWYNFSYSIIVIVSLITASVFIFISSNEIFFSIVFLVFAGIYSADFLSNYFIPLHFITIDDESILIVNKKIHLLTPEYIKEIYYRNDILIFQLRNDKTIYINFAETQHPAILRQQFSEWLKKHHLSDDHIIQNLKTTH